MSKKLFSVLVIISVLAALFTSFCAADEHLNILPAKTKSIAANISKRNQGLEIENVIDGIDSTRFVSKESESGELTVTVNLKKEFSLTAVAVRERFFTVGSMANGVNVEVGTSETMKAVVQNGKLNSGTTGSDGEIVRTEFSFAAASGNIIKFTFTPGALKGNGESLYQLAELEAFGTEISSGESGEEETNYMTERIYNPYLPSYEYIPDGEPHVFGDRVYIFGSHDHYEGADWCGTDYVAWSAPANDLSAWRCDGVIWDCDSDPSYSSGQALYAPDVTKGADGKYYLYYPLNGSGRIGVAKCDTPAGKYEYLGAVQYPDGTYYGRKAGDPPACDPAAYVDDDGRVYFYAGYTTHDETEYNGQIANGVGADGAYCVELESDMVTVKENTRRRIVPGKYITGEQGNEEYAENGFFEAASMRKINGKYYFIYSKEEGHQLAYAVGNSPSGPFSFGGIIVCNTDVGYEGNVERKAIYGNNHGSIAEINGEYYIFYHRQTGKKCRQGCAEKININSDGSINQVEITSFGLGGGRPMLAKGKFPAYIACNISQGASYAQTGKDGDVFAKQYVSALKTGEYVGYKYFYFKDTNKISVTAKAPSGGKIKVYTGAMIGSPIAEIPLSATSEWTKFSQDVKFDNGTEALFFVYEGSGTLDILDFTLGEEGESHEVSISGSEAAVSGAGSYQSGETVAVSAGSREGYAFDGWTVNGNAKLADIGSAETSFIMPEENVSLTALWKAAPPTPKNILLASQNHVTKAEVNLPAVVPVLGEYKMRNGEIASNGDDRYAAKTGDEPLIITYTLDKIYDFSKISVYERFQGYTFGEEVKIEVGNVKNGAYVFEEALSGGRLKQGAEPGNVNIAPCVRTDFNISAKGSALRFTFTNKWEDKDGNPTGGVQSNGGKEVSTGYSFFELEAYGIEIEGGDLPYNVCLGKAVSVNLPAEYAALPASAITDGSYEDKLMTETEYDRYTSPPSPKEALVVTIDLDGVYDIGWAEFNSRFVVNEGVIADRVKVEVGRSGAFGTTWTVANDNVILNKGGDGEHVSTLIPFEKTLTGNEMRFTLFRNSYSSPCNYNIAEIMAYGNKAETKTEDSIGSVRFMKSKSGAVTAAVKVVKQEENSVLPEKTILILCTYKNNRLVSVDKKEYTPAVGGNELTATVDSVDDGCDIKAFLWESATLKPLIGCEAYIAQ